MDDSSKRVTPLIAEVYRDAKLDFRVRFGSAAESADTSCSEPATVTQSDDGALVGSGQHLSTGAEGANESVFAALSTARGAPVTDDNYPSREEMLADPVIAGRVAVMRMARK